MGIWNEGGFFQSMKGHLIKWWQIVIMPVFRLNNNRNSASETLQMDAVTTVPKKIMTEDVEGTGSNVDKKIGCIETEIDNQSQNNADSDTTDILRRFEQQKKEEEERKRKEIEAVRRKAQEEERIAAIMNANKVAVDSFIAEGKANRETQEELDAKNAEEEKKQEELRRAQEIIDRLNREAAEDEAKKQAEIAKAKEDAKEKFG